MAERLLAGRTGLVHQGKGKISFGRAPEVGIDARLWRLLTIAADECGLVVHVSSVDTGEHAAHSRHYSGRAVDIDQVGQVGKGLRPATLDNKAAAQLAHWFRSHRFLAYEGGPWRALLWGPPRSQGNASTVPHNGHLHASIADEEPVA